MDRKIFLIATSDTDRLKSLEQWISKRISGVRIFSASDGIEAMSKIENAPPHVIFTDLELAKLSGTKLIMNVLSRQELASTAVIVSGALPKKEIFVDEFVTGRLQFIADAGDEKELSHCVTKALNFA